MLYDNNATKEKWKFASCRVPKSEIRKNLNMQKIPDLQYLIK